MKLPEIPKEYLQQIDCLQPERPLESMLEFEELHRWAAQSDLHRKAVELAVEKSRKWDLQLEQLMPEVVVPNDLQQRLCSAVSGTSSVPPVESGSVIRERTRRQRGITVAMYGASMATVLMVALAVIGLTDILYLQPAITEADIQRSTDSWQKQLYECYFRAERPAELVDFPKCPDINPKLQWQGYAKLATEFGPALGSYVCVGKTANGSPRNCFLLTFRNDDDYDLRQINVSMPPTPKSGGVSNQLFAASRDKEFVHVLLFSNHEDYAQLVKPQVILTDSSVELETYVALAKSKKLKKWWSKTQHHHMAF